MSFAATPMAVAFILRPLMWYVIQECRITVIRRFRKLLKLQMKYSLWYKKTDLLSIPECALLDKDYEYIGEIEASNRMDLFLKLRDGGDDEVEVSRGLGIGDVVLDE